jgi:Xaa-Pro dipeptidase
MKRDRRTQDSIFMSLTETVKPITTNERQQRLALLQAAMASHELDAVIVTPGANMRYFFGLTWRETERLVCAVISESAVVFVCPKFEDTALLAALSSPADCVWWEEHEDPRQAVASILAESSFSRVGIDPNCSFGQVHALSNATRSTLTSAGDLFQSLRGQKSATEIALLQAAKSLTLQVHQQTFEWIRPGVRMSEVIAKIDHLHRAGGADYGSFFCAVQFGEGTSHPHGVPGDPVLQKGELILIDTGCTVGGYHSDITRTYALDKQDSKVEALWDLEREAQAAALDAAQLGSPCGSVDTAARSVLERHGLGPDYQLPGLPHRTGHGIGLDIHEGPYLVRGDDTPLAEGMCFSNEPMIVIPGQFGIRLEDHFYMTDQGPKWFTEPQQSLYQPFS